MTTTRLAALLLVPALLGTGCVVAQTRTRTWSEDQQAPDPREQLWYGRVTQVRETVEEYVGDPAGGAVAGAVVGGMVGHALSGGHGGGLFGAVAGAMIGADASRGRGQRWFYEVTVHYDDGSLRTYPYANRAPFRVGDDVVLSSRGLSLR
jgi:outer membrane lipoprotein SlyB